MPSSVISSDSSSSVSNWSSASSSDESAPSRRVFRNLQDDVISELSGWINGSESYVESLGSSNEYEVPSDRDSESGACGEIKEEREEKEVKSEIFEARPFADDFIRNHYFEFLPRYPDRLHETIEQSLRPEDFRNFYYLAEMPGFYEGMREDFVEWICQRLSQGSPSFSLFILNGGTYRQRQALIQEWMRQSPLIQERLAFFHQVEGLVRQEVNQWYEQTFPFLAIDPSLREEIFRTTLWSFHFQERTPDLYVIQQRIQEYLGEFTENVRTHLNRLEAFIASEQGRALLITHREQAFFKRQFYGDPRFKKQGFFDNVSISRIFEFSARAIYWMHCQGLFFDHAEVPLFFIEAVKASLGNSYGLQDVDIHEVICSFFQKTEFREEWESKLVDFLIVLQKHLPVENWDCNQLLNVFCTGSSCLTPLRISLLSKRMLVRR